MDHSGKVQFSLGFAKDDLPYFHPVFSGRLDSSENANICVDILKLLTSISTDSSIFESDKKYWFLFIFPLNFYSVFPHPQYFISL